MVGGPFSYKQMMEPQCLEDTSCGLVPGAFGRDRHVSSFLPGSAGCLTTGLMLPSPSLGGLEESSVLQGCLAPGSFATLSSKGATPTLEEVSR